MKRLMIIMLTVMLAAVLGACGSKANVSEGETIIIKEKDFVIEKDEKYPRFDQVAKLSYDIKNKTDKNVFIIVEEMEVDGVPLEEGSYVFLNGIDAKGEVEDATITVLDSGDSNFPEFNESAKFLMSVVDSETELVLESVRLTISFK